MLSTVISHITLDHDPFTIMGQLSLFAGGLGVVAALTYFKRWKWLWREWLTSTDPKRIGVMYLVVALLMLLRGAIDAAIGALHERFRPLIATSLTAIIALVPLGLMSPFWEGLVVVLVFWLLSSTLLVITVFPYYYLGAEYLRLRISRAAALGWLALAGVSTAVLIAAGFGAVALLAVPFSAVVLGIYGRLKRR